MKRQIVVTLNDDDYYRIMDYGLILEADRSILASAIKHGILLDKIRAEIDNLCDTCVTKGCIFQSGIVRNHCDFYKAESE